MLNVLEVLANSFASRSGLEVSDRAADVVQGKPHSQSCIAENMIREIFIVLLTFLARGKQHLKTRQLRVTIGCAICSHWLTHVPMVLSQDKSYEMRSAAANRRGKNCFDQPPFK